MRSSLLFTLALVIVTILSSELVTTAQQERWACGTRTPSSEELDYLEHQMNTMVTQGLFPKADGPVTTIAVYMNIHMESQWDFSLPNTVDGKGSITDQQIRTQIGRWLVSPVVSDFISQLVVLTI